MLKNKKIILAVTGSIAAYKSAMLVRLLVKAEAEVQVLMTKDAQRFITPLTLATLSKNPVLSSFEKQDEGVWNNHVDLGLWADAIIFAPVTAHTLAKCATAAADNLIIATYLSARCPVFFAPAMDLDMYQHPATQANLQKLESYGNYIIQSEEGELASGLVGQGRMAEPEHILSYLEQFFNKNLPLKGKKALVTAGPTYEAFDPVRFIGNHSSGKMGFAIAESLAEAGVEVELVSGPSQLSTNHPNINLHKVMSAQEMYEKADSFFIEMDYTVLSAAVADYRPKVKFEQKMKKKEGDLMLELERTIDIAKTLGQKKKENQILVGFAMETQNEIENAKRKLDSKNLDLIVLNTLNTPKAGFQHDTNKVWLIGKKEEIIDLPLKTKKEVANDIVQYLLNLND